MSALADYIRNNTRCIPREESAPETAVNVEFFKVVADPKADAQTLQGLVLAHSGEWGKVDVFDGGEHSYLELGGWLGSQEYALRLIGLGSHLGLWTLLSPRTMLKDLVDDEIAQALAQRGLISVQAHKQSSSQA